MLGASRAGVFGEEAIDQGLAVRLPSAVPRSVYKFQLTQLTEYLRDSRLRDVGPGCQSRRPERFIFFPVRAYECPDDGKAAGAARQGFR